jgi:regulatory protein YycH of two-component signal transduction system YycFG
MKRYSNRTRSLQKLKFSEGGVQFLFGGQSILTNKNVESFTDGIAVTEEKTRKKSTKEQQASEDKNSDKAD